ncbi:hypothetical protein EJ06DRAFT_291534 [Trichodelitschia bisporula]|uniref:Uncharacterized protein n=1 Tax=Trichodelitschia bisporula TaxID=703511 RepID=A0A6G1I6W4_9PEZI|nr:hypothetical protein EJ06DRAFT_291534 [Trichodelitschia bisporula]
MSVARAFTLRSRRPDMPTPSPLRASSMRSSGKGIDRSLISPPVALISTTNMLSYNAPDIATAKTLRKASSSISSGSSRSSADDSDASTPSHRSGATFSSVSSVSSSPGSSPTAHNSVGPFVSKKPSVYRSISSAELRYKARPTEKLPEVPMRAPSHSKQAHEQLARKRSVMQFSAHNSVQSARSVQSDLDVTREHRTSLDFFTGGITNGTDGAIESSHPFGRELEQLDEVVEEFGGAVRDAERDEDFAAMKKLGLAKFCADDYMRELRPLFVDMFEPRVTTWI